MSVMLRMSRLGKKRVPFYRIIATDRENKRDGRFLQVVGTYNPMTNPPVANLKEDLIKKWVEVGAKPTRIVADLIEKQFPGLIKNRIEHQRKKIQAARKARKERTKKRTKAK